MTCLARLNLTTISDGAVRRLVRVHALVQRAARDQAPAEIMAAAIDAAAQCLLECWPETEDARGVGSSLRANTQALRQHGEDRLWCAGAHALLFRAGRSLGEAGLVASTIDHFHRLTIQAAAWLGPATPTPWKPAPTLPSGRGRLVMRPGLSPRARRCWPTVYVYSAPTTSTY